MRGQLAYVLRKAISSTRCEAATSFVDIYVTNMESECPGYFNANQLMCDQSAADYIYSIIMFKIIDPCSVKFVYYYCMH